MFVIKKDGRKEEYNRERIKRACEKSSNRAMQKLNDEDYEKIYNFVETDLYDEIPVSEIHNLVEMALNEVNPKIAKSYRDYRNYKTDFVHMLDKVYEKSQSIRYIGDRDNANTDSTLVPTQRSLIYNELNGELYKKFFLNVEERQAMSDGYIYIHDRSARLDTMNCCLFKVDEVLKDGFEMANIWYNEPKTLDVAFDVISDLAMSAAACQYGGFTMPRIDSTLAPYAEKSYKVYTQEFKSIANTLNTKEEELEVLADQYAEKKIRRDFEQGFQSWEYKFNTLGSSRGDYPFIAVSFGIDTSRWGLMASEICLKTRAGGQGKKGFKKPVLFPKLTFLYDDNLHGERKEFEWLFDVACECSSKTMYPDFLSLTGDGYIASMYKKYGKVISLMGKRKLSSYKISLTMLNRCA